MTEIIQYHQSCYNLHEVRPVGLKPLYSGVLLCIDRVNITALAGRGRGASMHARDDVNQESAGKISVSFFHIIGSESMTIYLILTEHCFQSTSSMTTRPIYSDMHGTGATRSRRQC